LAAVLFFASGLTMYFEKAPRPLWVLAVHYTSLVLAATQAVITATVEPRSDAWAAVGVAMYMFAVAVFLAAIESAQRTRLQRSFVDLPLPDRLITDGSYRWVRHPFCSGYLLGALAAPVATDHLGLFVVAAGMVIIIVAAAVREERVWLSSPRAEEYREYRRRTGMFIPFIGRG